MRAVRNWFEIDSLAGRFCGNWFEIDSLGGRFCGNWFEIDTLGGRFCGGFAANLNCRAHGPAFVWTCTR
jgi:hypothetical protein